MIEGWFPSIAEPTLQAVLSLARTYLLLSKGPLESDFCAEFEEEAREIWPAQVHRQYPIAHGTTLLIDFHIGPVRRPGVGVEFKVPKTTSDVQRAKGQLDDYLSGYRDQLILVIIDDGSLRDATLTLFEQQARHRGVAVVTRETP